VWIKDAPVIGKYLSEDVLNWIKSRISCRIPDEKANPDLSLNINFINAQTTVRGSVNMERHMSQSACLVSQEKLQKKES